MNTKCLVIKIIAGLFVMNLLSGKSLAHSPDSLKQGVYHINYFIDVPITATLIATNFWGIKIVDKKTPLDSLTIIGLDAKNINRFDRSATRQDADYAPTARKISDFGMYGSYALPLLLLADADIRKDWAPLMVLYLETMATAGNLFSWGAAMHIDRIRPLVYNPDVPWKEKTGIRTQNAFYSGHTSSSATASFFVAKVYCDYHPELGNKKYIFYSLALIPPVFTGYHRYKGMKHFPTDVIAGVIVGAGTGILIPHIHKITRSNLAVMPYIGEYKGMALSLKF